MATAYEISANSIQLHPFARFPLGDTYCAQLDEEIALREDGLRLERILYYLPKVSMTQDPAYPTFAGSIGVELDSGTFTTSQLLYYRYIFQIDKASIAAITPGHRSTSNDRRSLHLIPFEID